MLRNLFQNYGKSLNRQRHEICPTSKAVKSRDMGVKTDTL
jgi:hypothetical protein